MTTANLMNAASVKSVNTQVAASKKLQEENLEAAEVFAGFMNQTMNFSNSLAKDYSVHTDVSEINFASPIDSYERYGYKDRQIDTADSSGISEKVEESGEALERAEQEIVDTICEEYGVDEEEVKNLLDEMGLSALDLLNPQKLVSFLVGLTGAASGEDLLLDENFLKVLESLNHLAENLLEELNMDMDDLQALVAEMEVSEDVELKGIETEEPIDAMPVNEENQNPESLFSAKVERQESAFANNQSAEGNSLLNQGSDVNQGTIVNQNTVNQIGDMSQTQFSSYLSTDTVQIMEQIVHQMRVNITPQTTSMEMQLNPENLGKVYVHISSEEGVVNAHFHAVNEVVKEALEAQVATLRENLNQAGVKVDAIEVTIASHEFERNLEQNQSQNQSEEQIAGSENHSTKRQNITLDSMEELSGLMTEEETLVAQIMKDNGNSVDFTA